MSVVHRTEPQPDPQPPGDPVPPDTGPGQPPQPPAPGPNEPSGQ
jgi:hypothetical protein